VGQYRFTIICDEWQIDIGPPKAVIAYIPPIASRRPVWPSPSSERRAPVSTSFGNRKFSSQRTTFVFISVARNTGYKFASTNKHAIFGPPIAAETCGKKDDVNFSGCQDVTRRRSARPE
jgi:hypothetical protein